MISARNNIAIKRINKDMKEITKNPIEGIGIVSLDDDPMKYIINIRLMMGPYEGYCVQLLLTFSDNYPTKPPKILIYPGQAIDGSYHHHIFQDNNIDENGQFFKKFCFDLLDNDFMSVSSEKSGWNPSYSISSLLLQVQNFISDPDGVVASDYQIAELKKSMDNYSRTFYVNTEQGKIKKVHTWSNPYPEMYFKNSEKKEAKEEKEEKEKKEEKKEKDEKKEKEEKIKDEIRIQLIKDNLNCFILKVNYIDDPNILLGYPIIQKKAQYGKNKIEIYPIPELLTYEGFTSQIALQGHMADLYFNFNQFKSANNEFYNNWVPIYINKDHYEKNKSIILNSFNTIASGSNINNNNNIFPNNNIVDSFMSSSNYSLMNFNNNGINNINNDNNNIINNDDYKPEKMFEVLPIILNSMIIGMFNGNAQCSSAFIRCYFQFILLFRKLSQEFESEYLGYLNSKLNEIKNKNYIVDKQIIPDIGNFFILLIFCTLDTNSEKMKKINLALFEESLIRQMYWIFHGEEQKGITKKLLLESYGSDKYFENFEKNSNFKMNALDKFNEDLRKVGIFEQVVDIISNDKGFLDNIFLGKEKVRGQVESRMGKSFKRLYNDCSQEGKNQLKELISKNLNFGDYFDGNSMMDETGLYDAFKVDEMLKKFKDNNNMDKFFEGVFRNQKGNQLYIISFFAQKKIEEPGFLEELEKNYGVYLDVDNFIKDMKKKLEEIKSYKDFYAFIGTDFGKDKTELKLFIDAYRKAKEKGYIKSFNNSLNNSYNSLMNRSNLSFSNNRINERFDRNNFAPRFDRNGRMQRSGRSGGNSFVNDYPRRRSRSRSRSRHRHHRNH